MPSETNGQYTKLIRFIIFGVLVTIGIVGWHIYEYLIRDHHAEEESARDYEIHELSHLLYNSEMPMTDLLVKVNFQGRTKPSAHDDRANRPLLELNADFLQLKGNADQSSTVVLLRRLYDNYEASTDVVEHVTQEEIVEEEEFLLAVLKTDIMKRTMQFLAFKGLVNSDKASQLQLLKDLWFTQYSRGHHVMSSSGFEHVFLAEIKDQNVLGLHNWIYFAEQEQQGKLNYQGYMDHLDLGKEHQHLVAVRFTYHGLMKPYNTLFVGTSPELEMSLYTMCFLLSGNQPCPVQLGDAKFNIMTYAWEWHGKKTIASAYPSLEKLGSTEQSPSRSRTVSH